MNKPIVPVTGSIGINIKTIRTRAHLILEPMEDAIISLSRICFIEMLKACLSIA